jgi:hypothetical protein
VDTNRLTGHAAAGSGDDTLLSTRGYSCIILQAAAVEAAPAAGTR